MAYNADILLGRITKTYGFGGDVTVKLEKTFIQNLPRMESVFLEIEGKPVPFFIGRSGYAGGDILRLRFTGYETFEKVSGFCGCRVFLTSGKKKDTGADKIPYRNFIVGLPDNTIVGRIVNLIENPGQWLLRINTPEGKEVLIPFHEDFIVSIDKEKKRIVMDLPEGLTDLN